MSRFECNICLKNFNRKAHLTYHVTNNICTTAQNNANKCKLCKKGFTTATNMYRHMRSACNVKKDEDHKRDKIYERLLELEKKSEKFEKENEKLKKEVVTLKKTITNNSNITTNNIQNINNGIVTTINLIGYGHEDLSKIDKNEIFKAINSGYKSAINLTETLHFNPKHPEYHNIYITNVKDKYAMIFDGKEWNLTTKVELIETIYDDKKSYIEDNMDEFVMSLSKSKIDALKRWLDTDDSDIKISKIKDNIKLLLYNKRNIVIDKQHKNMDKTQKNKKR